MEKVKKKNSFTDYNTPLSETFRFQPGILLFAGGSLCNQVSTGDTLLYIGARHP
jgi:hypothetical protein